LDELISYSLENLKRIEGRPNIDYIEPQKSSEENEEIYSTLIRKRDNAGEFDDYDDQK
jgi:hypothetical protein